MNFRDERILSSPTGAALRLYVTLASGKASGVVFVNHGLAEHAGRYARFGAAMAERGFHVYAHDHRGHGGTTAPDAPRGQFASSNGIAKVIRDCDAVRDLIAAEHPGLPVILFGHSMGALIALSYLLNHPDRVTGAAIWNATLTPAFVARAAKALLAWERFRLGSDVPSRLLPKLTFDAWAKAVPERNSAFDWLSRDRSEVAAYVADPLCGWNATVSMWSDIFDLILAATDNRLLAGLPRSMPFHLVGGGSDPSTNGGKAIAHFAARLRRKGFSDVEARVYEQTRHESLNELNRDAIVSDFARWAHRVVR